MAGRFAAGGTAARAAWESIGTYQKACLTAATAKAKAELAALDAAPAALPPNSYGDDLCRGVIAAANRSEERRVGKECVSTCRSRWSRDHSKKNNTSRISKTR